MRTHLFLGTLAICVPLYASHVYNDHKITSDEVKEKLPDSERLHERIGKKGFYEKQYATLTFTKKTKDDADLTTLVLQWNGPHIGDSQTKQASEEARTLYHFSGTLFKKTDKLIATREYQLAQGTWNEKTQQLTFIFKHPYALQGTTKFSVVLTINDHLDALLQEGLFTLIQSSLPDAFQTTKKETFA